MCFFFLVPDPEGEQKPAADKAPGGDGKDAPDEKMEGKWNGKYNLCPSHILIMLHHGAEECILPFPS